MSYLDHECPRCQAEPGRTCLNSAPMVCVARVEAHAQRLEGIESKLSDLIEKAYGIMLRLER